MRARVIWVPLTAALLGLTGCAGGTQLLTKYSTSSGSAPSSARSAPASKSSEVSTAAYLARLRAEQRRLARAEQRIPTQAPTAQALARSAQLLAAAVARLARGLAATRPPSSVASLHDKLIGIVRAYARRLRRAATEAAQPGGELQAGQLLVSATNTASTKFSATIAKIYSTLNVPQP